MTRTVERALLGCGVVGGPLFVVVFLVEGALRPDYSPLRHPVSSLALGDFGWVQTINFLVTGALMLAFAVGLRPALRRFGAGIWAPVLVGAFAVGLVGAGVWATDPISGYPPGTPLVPAGTTHGALHDGFSLLTFAGLPAACFVLGWRFGRSGHRAWAAYSVATGVAFLVGFVLASMGFSQDATLVAFGGLLQRLTIVLGLTWTTVLAAYLRSRTSARAPAPVAGRAG